MIEDGDDWGWWWLQIMMIGDGDDWGWWWLGMVMIGDGGDWGWWWLGMVMIADGDKRMIIMGESIIEIRRASLIDLKPTLLTCYSTPVSPSSRRSWSGIWNKMSNPLPISWFKPQKHNGLQLIYLSFTFRVSNNIDNCLHKSWCHSYLTYSCATQTLQIHRNT